MEDPLSAVRGILIGLPFSLAIWIAIIILVYYC